MANAAAEVLRHGLVRLRKNESTRLETCESVSLSHFFFTMRSFLEKLKARVGELQTEAHVLHIALRDARTPWYAKAVTFFLLAYIFSPFDLIPDFIPFIGYLDDILVVSMGIPL